MTTFVSSHRNSHVLIGFFALVAAAIAIRAAVAGSTGIAIIGVIVAVGLIAAGIRLRSVPGLELRVSPTEIVLSSSTRVLGRISHAESDGRIRLHERIHRGHMWTSLAAAGMPEESHLSLEGFRMAHEELEAACTAHGWQLSR